MDAAESYLDPAESKRIREAYRYSDSAHLGQFRTSGDPYISHPISVAEICASWRLDSESLMAALLHDVMEDSGVLKQDLHEKFGPQVAEIVDGLSKIDRVEFESRAHAQAENFRKMLLAMARDVRVILIKLADRLHNMRTLDAVPAAKQSRVAQETLDIYAPIAQRLGLRQVFLELQDLAFKALHPWRHKTLRRALQSARGVRREALGKIQEASQRKIAEFGLQGDVYGRHKALASVYQKMREKHLSFSQVFDIHAFRILVDDVKSCYIALGALHGLYKPVPGRFKDYIALPKDNGYQSLHTTLIGPIGTPVEFQIRTYQMQQIAESGVAAHWIYKADHESFSTLQQKTHDWLKTLLDIEDQSRDSLEFIENVKIDLYPAEVFVCTPKGEIRTLPRGATVIDYAYSVHTDVGDRTVSAVINGVSVPLRTELRNGDLVVVTTSPDAAPQASWLSFAKTGKARSEIRHYLKTVNLAESIEWGKRLLDQAFASLRVDAASIAPEALEKGAREAGSKSVSDLYADIGVGKKLATVIARELSIQLFAKPLAALILSKPAPIILSGGEGTAVTYAACCLPLAGDKVFGHLGGGHGLVVHRTECSSANKQRIKDQERWVEVTWAEDLVGSFKTSLEVSVGDTKGILARVAGEISGSEANIINVGMHDLGGEAILRFDLLVRNRDHLAVVMRKVRGVTSVKKIVRLGQL
jgi:GTP diphosphokinase / guanosine-3',5'-bis(diphosphate) 3'-diphosphatase